MVDDEVIHFRHEHALILFQTHVTFKIYTASLKL